MAKKKTQEKKNYDNPNVVGLRAEVLEQPITETLETNYMPYAMSVIVSRAIPEIDGFKPSHRKLLYTMFKMGLQAGGRTKSANIVGQTMKLNPHGDAAIYETMVRLSAGYQALLMPFVDSKGNFGKVYSRDMSYAASRYTEAKLSGICSEVYNMNGPAVYKGFPTVDGADGSAAIPQLQLAILESCADKTAAWEFVRTFLTPEYQQSITNHLPLRLDALQQRAEEAMLPLPENESPSDGHRPTTQAEADQTMALITSVSTVYQWDNALLVMAQEEADGFFDGSRTAEETASALQSRAEAYFRENR